MDASIKKLTIANIYQEMDASMKNQQLLTSIKRALLIK